MWRRKVRSSCCYKSREGRTDVTDCAYAQSGLGAARRVGGGATVLNSRAPGLFFTNVVSLLMMALVFLQAQGMNLMNKYGTLSYKVATRIRRKNQLVFLRKDFADLGGYDQIGRILRELARAGQLVKIGYGLYAKAKTSALTGGVVPAAPLPVLAKKALERLGVTIAPSRLAQAYNTGQTTASTHRSPRCRQRAHQPQNRLCRSHDQL